jgi:hypothetical protein
MAAQFKVSSHLLAQILRESGAWPEDTVIEPLEHCPDMTFSVSSDTLPEGATEVIPVMRKDADGTVHFVEWMVW